MPAGSNDFASSFFENAEYVDASPRYTGPMFDWNDLRFLIAVADAGSTLAAARQLRVSQTTVARRLHALEGALGIALFERRQSGYVPTPEGAGLLDLARQVEQAAGRISDKAAASAREVSGSVRLTTVEIYAVTVLPPILRDLHRAHPRIRVELDTSPEVRDLAGGGADIALRRNPAITDSGLVGRRIADDRWTLYCSRAYADLHGAPKTRAELRGHVLIGGGEDKVWRQYQAWLERHDLEDSVAMSHDTVAGMLAAVRSGFGIAALPSFYADHDPELVRCLPPMPEHDDALWLLTHERLRNVPKVRAVLDFLAERLTR